MTPIPVDIIVGIRKALLGFSVPDFEVAETFHGRHDPDALILITKEGPASFEIRVKPAEGKPAEGKPAARKPLEDRHREALRRILKAGGHVTLGTEAARSAWYDGLPEVVALIGAHFTPEELDLIAAGAE